MRYSLFQFGFNSLAQKRGPKDTRRAHLSGLFETSSETALDGPSETLFRPLPACQVKAAQSVLQGSQAAGHLGYRAVAAGPEESGRCRSLTVKPSLACLSVTSMRSWCMTHSPSPSRRPEMLPGAGTRPARRSAGPWPVS